MPLCSVVRAYFIMNKKNENVILSALPRLSSPYSEKMVKRHSYSERFSDESVCVCVCVQLLLLGTCEILISNK